MRPTVEEVGWTVMEISTGEEKMTMQRDCASSIPMECNAYRWNVMDADKPGIIYIEGQPKN